MSDVMTVAEFAARLRISRSSAYRRITAGEVTVNNVGTRRRPKLRITEQEYTAYLERREIRRSEDQET